MIATGDAYIDQANLPIMDDPRKLPDLMNLVREMGDDCIWSRYTEVATKQPFLECGYKFNPSGSNPNPLQARI